MTRGRIIGGARATVWTLAGFALLLIGLVACGGAGAKSPTDVTLHLGYFPNVTHATALVGIEKGIFAADLPPGAKLATNVFNAGPAAVEALFAGSIDATYIGPNPSINAFAKSHGEAIRIVSGATSGGAFLVVSPSIKSAADLRGKKVASPQLGNTQDVALRSWLRSKALSTDQQGGGDVSVVPQENSQTLETFRSGQIAGAWVPEPWASRLVLEGGGKILVDERDLWPAGRYVTTQLIVRTAFLRDHPAVVKGLLRGQVEANDFVNQHAAEAKQLVDTAISKVTGKSLAANVLDRSWKNLVFTDDPIASSLRASAANATALGVLDKVDLAGIYDLTLLNQVLQAARKPVISTG